MKRLVATVLLLVFFVSGCTDQIKNIGTCEPDWIRATHLMFLDNPVDMEETCKSVCFGLSEVTSSKVSGVIREVYGQEVLTYYCYCDINDCEA